MYWHEATFSCPFLSWQFKIPSKIKHFTSIIHQKNQNFIKYKMSPFWVLIHRFNPRIHILFAAFIDLYSRHFLHLFNFISSKSNGITLKRPPSMGLNKKIPKFTEMNNFPAKVIPYTKFKKKTTTPDFSQTVPLCEEQVSLLRILISIEPNKYFGFINEFSSIFLLNAHSRLFRVKRRRNLFSSVQFTQLIEI